MTRWQYLFIKMDEMHNAIGGCEDPIQKKINEAGEKGFRMREPHPELKYTIIMEREIPEPTDSTPTLTSDFRIEKCNENDVGN